MNMYECEKIKILKLNIQKYEELLPAQRPTETLRTRERIETI